MMRDYSNFLQLKFWLLILYFVLQYSMIMEESTPSKNQAYENMCNTSAKVKYEQQNHSQVNQLSLPDLSASFQTQKKVVARSSHNQLYQEHPLIIDCIDKLALDEIKYKNINKRVFQLIFGLLSHHEEYQLLLETFQKFQKDIKMVVNRSTRTLRTFKNVENRISLKELLGSTKILKKDKKGKKVQFTQINEESRYDNISIKMINSNIKLSKKELTSFRQAVKSLTKLFSIGETVEVQQKTKERGSDLLNDIIEQNKDQPQQKQGIESQRGIFSGSLERIQYLAKNISIIVLEDEQGTESQLFSSEMSLRSLDSIIKSQIPLTQSFVNRIFQNSSPFLVNLCLCLLFKCLMKSKIELKPTNISWLLIIAAIVANKIFYDEELYGLLEYFSNLLEMKIEDVIYLEKWFLQSINYQAFITNRQYYQILCRIIPQRAVEKTK